MTRCTANITHSYAHHYLGTVMGLLWCDRDAAHTDDPDNLTHTCTDNLGTRWEWYGMHVTALEGSAR